MSLMLSLSSEGNEGALFPQKFGDMLPRLNQNELRNLTLDKLRAVALRVDPCFQLDSKSACSRQVRLVLQPLSNVGRINPEADDVALHFFYQLSDESFRTLLGQLANLQSSYPLFDISEPLQVNPILLREGFAGDYWRKLKLLLLKFVGERNLVRFTFMSLEIPESMWDFGGFNVIGGKVQRIAIPRVNSRLQSFLNSGKSGNFKGGARPSPPVAAENFDTIISNSSELTESDALVLTTAASLAIKIENPNLASPATVDCVSCHVTQPLLTWQKKFDLNLSNSEFKFGSEFNLLNESQLNFSTRMLRSFGYLGTTPLISQRTINESAQVAEALNQNPIKFR